MDEDRDPPGVNDPSDRQAPRDVARLAAPPAIFLAHFAAIYGLQGLACAVVGGGETAPRWPLLAITVAGVLLAWWFRPRPSPRPGEDVADPYDPAERRHFLAWAGRATAWLAIAGMLAVTVPVLLVPAGCPAVP